MTEQSPALVANRGPSSMLTGEGTWFEDFRPAQRWRSARGSTIDEVENQLLTKLVMNSAQEHWNDHSMLASPWGDRRLVFGMITGALTISLASQDTAENAIAEVELDQMRFRAPVFHGDSIYAYTEVLAADPCPDREDAGLVRFRHWGATGDLRIVFECERIVLVKRRSHWLSR
jgi:itaconyl-CoA hydratase